MVRCFCGLLLVLGVALSDCPSGCCCPRPGALVLCESLGLRSLPRSVPLSTSVLSMARNQLCDVDHLLLPFSGLQELSLSHNQLPHFPKGLPPSLEALQLQENRITYLTAGSLRQLGNLTRLDLEDNRIRVIQPGAFAGLSKLRVLSLKGNRLLSLPLSLPPSLTHLDLSSNCISALDLQSLANLVNLQVLKINSNCLRSVPESAFESLPRLRTVELADNLWVCECDILYLYRWLLDGRLRLATDLVCTAPLHLARRLLLTLSVMAICPRMLRPNNTVPLNSTAVSAGGLQNHRMHAETRAKLAAVQPRPTTPGRLPRCSTLAAERKPSPTDELTQAPRANRVRLQSRLSPTQMALEELSYEDCLSLHSSPTPTIPAEGPPEDPRCTDNSTSYRPAGNYTASELTSPVLPTNKAGFLPATAPGPVRLPEPTIVTALLAVLCVLVAFVLLAVLLVLKKLLHRNQRVAPAQLS
ncbi:hypothetical protein MATL_G00060720 [Megalops atlanticus]|uniref:LRRCT domain-containing protein n=1 Tax=Megalops atlanticus TaxID=7932 RepID=A0A9D3Q6U8_MEGAT|nr:hypothetical protein MATL_G00060720 [Megalops atlanticus]